MIESIEELRTFVRILSAGSLSKAASSLGLNLQAVSKRLSALETRAGVRLINRTTRLLAPTDEGRDLYDRAERILQEVEAAEDMLRGGKVGTFGLLRISAPVVLGERYLSPVCSYLVGEYPEVTIDLILSERIVDFAEERIDVGIRFGDLRHPTAIVRKLVENHRVIVATSSYVERHGQPSTPEEIVRHNCLTHRKNEATWRLLGVKGESCDIKISSSLFCNEVNVVNSWMRNGAGLMLMDWVNAADEIKSGRVIQVLKYWRSESHPIFALYPANQAVAPKTKLFLELLENRLRDLSS